MLYSVRGKLIAIESNAAVVECGGVGYMCQTTMNTLKAVKLNTEVTLYTYLNVREDAVDLFGFATKAELETFKNLISVSGVGPKAGLAVLSELSPEQVAMAIASDDLKTITRAQGIGKKIAQRIVLELKDKLAKAAKEDSSFAQAAQNSVNVSTGTGFDLLTENGSYFIILVRRLAFMPAGGATTGKRRDEIEQKEAMDDAWTAHAHRAASHRDRPDRS